MTDPTMTSFLEACGSAGPLPLGVEAPGAAGPSWRMLDQPFAVVGRGAGADIRLDDPDLSRRHAYFQMIAGRLFCVDLGSRTGTRWGLEAGSWGWVDAENPVRVGGHRVRPRSERASRAGRPATAQPAIPLSRSFAGSDDAEVALEIRSGATTPVSWRVSRSLVLIGRSPACKIRLDGPGIANIHASLVRTPHGLFIVDLLGPAGVAIGGRAVRWGRLRDDDEVVLGDHTIRVRDRVVSRGTAVAVRAADRAPGVTELVPVAGPTEGADRGELRGLVAEFTRVQQQSADRFQDTLMAVVRSFVAMQQEQMDLIRAELEAIRRLNEEHQALQGQVDRWEREARRPVALRLVAGDAGFGHGIGTIPPPASSRKRKPATESSPTTPMKLVGPPRTGPLDVRRPEPAAGGGEAFHAQIFDRLAAIRGEQLTRWQRLKRSMLGMEG